MIVNTLIIMDSCFEYFFFLLDIGLGAIFLLKKLLEVLHLVTVSLIKFELESFVFLFELYLLGLKCLLLIKKNFLLLIECVSIWVKLFNGSDSIILTGHEHRLPWVQLCTNLVIHGFRLWKRIQ